MYGNVEITSDQLTTGFAIGKVNNDKLGNRETGQKRSDISIY
jgi:hypothetical protein